MIRQSQLSVSCPNSTRRAAQLWMKQLLDRATAGALLLALLPLLLVIAVLVRLSSPGPILFRQRRVGKDGVEFNMLKFRTMFSNNDPNVHETYYRALVKGEARPIAGQFKLARDPRVTSVGRMLRRFSLDELPQLLNVLK